MTEGEGSGVFGDVVHPFSWLKIEEMTLSHPMSLPPIGVHLVEP